MYSIKIGNLEPVSFPSISAVIVELTTWKEMLEWVINEFKSDTVIKPLFPLGNLYSHDFSKKPVVKVFDVKSIYIPETIVVVKQESDDVFAEGTDRAFE